MNLSEVPHVDSWRTIRRELRDGENQTVLQVTTDLDIDIFSDSYDSSGLDDLLEKLREYLDRHSLLVEAIEVVTKK